MLYRGTLKSERKHPLLHTRRKKIFPEKKVGVARIAVNFSRNKSSKRKSNRCFAFCFSEKTSTHSHE